MTTGEGRERERFAASVEDGLAAVPPGDEQLRRELEVVALLRASRSALAPDADASARMRARVMAAATTMLPSQDADAESGSIRTLSPVDASTLAAPVASIQSSDDPAGQPTNVVPIGSAPGRHRFPARTAIAPSARRRGLLGVSAAAALMVLAVTGGGAMFSQDALPGDTLYGVKQTTESALVGLTPGQGNKAQRQLDYAATRIDEVQALNSSQATSGDRGADIAQALRGFNEQATAGSRMWLSSAGSGNPAELGTLAGWASSQHQRLAALRSSMPSDAQPDADSSLRLLEQVRTRAQALSNRKNCDKVTSGDSDEFGPLPARGACGTKEPTTGPQIRSVTPSSPTRSDRSTAPGPSSSTTPSGSSRPNAPGLPGLPDLSGNGPENGVGPLPGREGTRSGDPLPSTPEQAPSSPGLNLPLPLLPILYQPMSPAPPDKAQS